MTWQQMMTRLHIFLHILLVCCMKVYFDKVKYFYILQVGDGDKFPPLLLDFQKKTYNMTISLSKENVKEGSHLYKASNISGPHEISATSSPTLKTSIDVKPTDINSVSCQLFNIVPTYFFLFKCMLCIQENTVSNNTPPTAKSSTKTRARKSSQTVQYDLSNETPLAKCKIIKKEKVCTIM